MKVLITGANGFVGQALWRRLAQLGLDCVGLARRPLSASQFKHGYYHQFDLSHNPQALANMLEGCDLVYHVASKVDLWGAYQDFYKANVIATQNLIEACKQAGVKALIYTSSPSVIADGRDLCGVNEDYPYPSSYLAYYPATKAIAEKLILQAGNQGLLTVSLRPHLIWGPGDHHLIPTIIERARAGRLPQIGNGENIVDTTYIDDCVEAHLNAWQALEKNPGISGRAYFISQAEPVKMWDWVRLILRRNNISCDLRKVPKAVANFIALICECKAKLSSSSEMPLLTRFAVHQLSSSHYFDISRAKNELGYAPKVSFNQALDLTFNQA